MTDEFCREARVQAEIERLQTQRLRHPVWHRTAYLIKRSVIRVFRIAGGLLLAFIALRSCGVVTDKTGIPLGSMTLGDLGAFFFCSICALALSLWALQLAFGSGPSNGPNSHEALLREASHNVAVSERAEATEAHERERRLQMYRRGKLFGILFDSELAKKYKWLPWVAVLLSYLLLFGAVTIFESQ